MTNVSGVNLTNFTNVTFRFNSTFDRWFLDDFKVYCGIPCIPPLDPIGVISGTTPACESTTLNFSGIAVPPFEYYWQTTTLGTDLSNNAATDLTVTTSGNYYVRAYNPVTSCWSVGEIGPYAVTINTTPTITTQPVDAVVTENGNTSFTVVASGTGLTYQWQVDTGSGFVDLTNVAPYSNVTTATLDITNATNAMNGYQYQCIVSGLTPCSIVSDVVLLTVNPLTGTTLVPGDLAIVAVNVNMGNATDQIAFVCFKDILPGTQIYLTDNGYERRYAGLWGGREGLVSITRTNTTLPKGSIIVFESTTANVTDANHFDIYTCGVVDTNWNKTALSGVNITGFNLNGVTDDLWIMQGGTWVNQTSHSSTYDGTVLYGWTGSGWDTLPGGNTNADSTLFPFLDCYTTTTIGFDRAKFNDPIDPDFSTTTNRNLDWIALINNAANWENYINNGTYNSGGYNYKGSTVCPAMTIDATGYVNGKWTGRQDTNWFSCGNWDNLEVPDETVDVLIEDTTFNNAAIVDATAPFAGLYGNIAKANNLTITGERVEITSDINNILEVHGDLIIDGTGVLDMNDGNNLTSDGTLHLYGNWSNLLDETAFDQGNGTVHFDGSTPQIITSLDPIGTEVFYNVILNNDFNTTISNNLIAQGDLTVSSSKTMTVEPNDYVLVNNKLQLDGDIIIENDGQLIQVNETDTNSGTYTGTKFQVNRIAQARNLDYVYWSSPVENYDVSNLPNSHRYKWFPTAPNPNSTQGYWMSAGGTMAVGEGYIARASNGSSAAVALPITFQGGKPHNGQISVPIERGFTTGTDDSWNLLGNPYPSAMDADSFLTDNTNIEGSVRIWMHGTLPAASPSPFYQNFTYNYTEDDYIVYNGTATSIPATFNGKIASGQGFFVRMLEDGETDITPPTNTTTAATSSVLFKNAYRRASDGSVYDNSEFFKNSSSTNEKSRIWLDLISPNNAVTRTVVGYVPGATLAKDRIYDALIDVDAFKLYTLINTQKQAIQGRPVPFDANDLVPMGMFIETAGNYTVAIAAVDGLFLDASQNIYLEDKLMNVIHNLKQAPYTFSTIAGEFNDRFVLRYTNAVLSNQQFEITNGLVIASNHKVSLLASENIQSVVIFDVLGRKIYDKNNINSTEVVLDHLTPTKEALIVKTIFEDGKVVTKKIIY